MINESSWSYAVDNSVTDEQTHGWTYYHMITISPFAYSGGDKKQAEYKITLTETLHTRQVLNIKTSHKWTCNRTQFGKKLSLIIKMRNNAVYNQVKVVNKRNKEKYLSK